MSTVTVVPTVEATTPPRVRLDVTDVGTPNLFATTVTRLNPDGRTVPVRTADGNALQLTTSGVTRVGLLYDYEMPYGAAVSYSTVESPTTVSPEVTVTETRVWLIHPGVPSLSMPITVASFANRTRSIKRGVHWPMGRSAPVIQTDGTRKAPSGAIEVKTLTLNELDDLTTLLDDGSPLYLNVPATLPWGVPSCYIAVDDVEEARLMDYASEPRRYVTLPYQVVDRPAGGSQAARTYADVLAAYPTYASLLPAYDTYLSLLAGP